MNFYHRRREGEVLQPGFNVTRAYGRTFVTFYWETRSGWRWKFGWCITPAWKAHDWTDDRTEWMWPPLVTWRPLHRRHRREDIFV